jgi:CHAT domain-containing protein
MHRPDLFFVRRLTLAAALALLGLTSPLRAAEADADQRMSAGHAAMLRGDTGGAENHWLAAAEMYRRAGDVAGRVEAMGNLGAAYQWAGDYDQAINTLREARALAEANGLRAQLASIDNSLGAAYTFSRRLKEAEDSLTQALTAAEEHGDATRMASILNNLGNLYAIQSEPDPDAASGAERAKGRRERELEKTRQASLKTRQDDAQAAFQEAADLADAAGDKLLAAKAVGNAAVSAARARDFVAADRLNGDALGRARTLDDSREKAFLLITVGLTDQQALDRAQSKERLLRRASDAFALAARVAAAIGDPLSRSYALGYRGQLYEREGRHDEAMALTRAATAEAQKAMSDDALVLWQWQKGRLFRAANDEGESLRAYRAARQTLRRIQDDIGQGNGNKGLYASFRRDFGPMLFELADLQLRQADASADDAARVEELLTEAQATVEMLKGAELQDYLQDPCVNQFRREKVKNVREVIEGLGTAVEHTAVVYLIPLKDRVEFLVITPRGLHRRQAAVGSEQLTAVVREFRRNLERRVSHRYKRQGRQLYDWLIKPIEDVLAAEQVDTLVFVPDGALRTIPMSALHDGKQFLVARYAVGVIPGIELTDVKANPLPPEAVRVLANGLSKTNPARAGEGFAPLPSVRGELSNIGQTYEGDTQTLLDEDFNEQNIRAALAADGAEAGDRPYSIIHIASHGVFGADADDTFLLTYDERLTLDELERLIKPKLIAKTPVELLTLSACQTAAGDDRAALGLAGVALKAGARSAVASLWFVSDEASSELITQFYRELADDPTATKAQAMQRAQLKMIEGKDFAHPIYWAPFMVFGNWL